VQQTGEKSITGGHSLDYLFDLISRGERKVGIGGLQQSAKSFLLSLLYTKIWERVSRETLFLIKEVAKKLLIGKKEKKCAKDY